MRRKIDKIRRLFLLASACPMCEAAVYWAGIGRMVYGEHAADAGRPSLCG